MTPVEQQEAKSFTAAVRKRDVAAVRRAIESSAFVRAHINDPWFDFGQRAVHCAANNPELLDLLLASGADLNLRSDWENGPFSVLDNADAEHARFVMSRGAPLTANVAARLGWMAELKEIIEADPSSVHMRGGDGQQPLHLAKTVEIADYLLDRGAEIDARCIDHKSTPAQYALVDRTDVCRRLLQRGASADIFMAVWLGDLALVERSIDADPAAISARINRPGYAAVPPLPIYCWTLGWMLSPHEIAISRNQPEILALLERRSPPRVRLLAAAMRGDEASAREAIREDPSLPASLTVEESGDLAQAIFHERFDAARLMLQLGYPLNGPGVDGGSPLHAACWMGRVPIVEALLARGVPFDGRDPTHLSTPLGWAAFGSVHRRAKGGDYIGVIERLVAAGADLSAPGNGAPQSLIEMAEGNGAVVAALRRLGAT